MFERFRRDIQRYFALESRSGKPTLGEKIGILLNAHALQGIAVYRFGAWAISAQRPKLIRFPLRAVYHVLNTSTIMMWGVHIDPRAQIDGGLYIGHTGGVLIGAIRMGRDCNIAHNVTIGRRADEHSSGLPTFGERVWIGAGSVLFGGIVVGDGAMVAPLTVVSRNVAPRSLVAGNPMKIIRQDYDNTKEIFGSVEAAPPS
jgi:serine O-acetyltransferase